MKESDIVLASAEHGIMENGSGETICNEGKMGRARFDPFITTLSWASPSKPQENYFTSPET